MSARSPFSKFSLKPSSLSQHTVNFNKILEEVPVPKIDEMILEKPKLGMALDVQPEIIKKDLIVKETESENKPKEESKPTEISAPAFVFGEQLTDRVINADEVKASDQPANGNSKTESNQATETKSTSIFGAAEHEIEKYNVDHLTDDGNTIIRMKVKLFCLDKDSKDQANWAERGYGTLKMIDSDDGINCKIMMWTDKCFRMVLNTKLFESMSIEKVNRKSIRLNAQDEGTLKIFLIKCGHPNECEELSIKMIHRLKTYRDNIEKMALHNDSQSMKSTVEATTTTTEKVVVLDCDCEVESVSKSTESSKKLNAKLQIYKNASKVSGEDLTNQFSFDILDADSQSKILSSRSLKLINIEQNQDSAVRVDVPLFEIKESFHLSHKVTLKTKETVENLLKLYKQVKRSEELNASLDDSNNETSTDEEEEEEESDSISALKSNTSRSLESSLAEGNDKSDADNIESAEKLNVQKTDETADESVSTVSKKRKSEMDDEENEDDKNAKKLSVNEADDAQKDEATTTGLKRAASNSSQESNPETNETKKTKVTEDDIF